MAHIVYEDDEIRAVWHSGDTDFLLVTFGDLFSHVDDVRFFADGSVTKSCLSCLGVMPKRANWYPAESMRKLRARVEQYIAPYKTRVTYGGSMGGYAAIKFSGLMSATHIIALCPQWSIDPAQVDVRFLPWGDFFTPSMAGMAIRHADISGRMVLFSDTRFEADEFHRSAIIREWPDAISINVNSSDHHVTTIFAGTQNLNDLIFAVRYLPPANILAVANSLRRRSLHRAEVVLRRAMPHYPRIVARTLIGRARKDPNYRGFRLRFYLDVLNALVTSGEHGLALKFVVNFSGQLGWRGCRRLLGICGQAISGKVRSGIEMLEFSGSSSFSLPS